MIYVLDSNIISYMLKDDKTVLKQFENTINDNNSYSVPSIVYYKIKRGLTVKKQLLN